MTNSAVKEASSHYQLSTVNSQLNEVPVGYKQTEVGVIPYDWEAACLGEIAAVRMCKRILAGQTQKVGAIPFFKIGTFGSEPDAYIPYSLYEEFKAKYSFPAEGDILISAAGTLGKSVVYDGKPAYFQDSNIVWLEINKRKLLNEYLYHYYKVIKWASSEGSTIARLYNGIIRASMIALPPIEEQTAIANALSDVDALISVLEKLIAKKQAIKTATMQQLLTGRTRLPQFALREDGTPKGTKPSELGEIPEDWEVMTLGDIGQTIIGLTYSPNDVAEFGTLVLRSSNVQNGKLAYVDNVFVNMDLPERVIVRQGDILICVRNGSRQLIGKCALIDKNAEGSAFGAFMSIFRTKHSVFVFYQFQSDLIQNQINEIMGATINQITNKDMSGFKITLPSDEKEQTAIATILFDMDAEIQALEQRLSKTRQIKQGMMQELLTGKTRLVKPAAAGGSYAH
ncbi:restriction endonuclease subunit S [Methylotuvimicrobium sp. KM2]|uniref:restriction endonuclease subunit S n=1 Tax=Methylotuvimicrobium sp. KM2 TaxID=3133976 RepID=UPI0031010272